MNNYNQPFSNNMSYGQPNGQYGQFGQYGQPYSQYPQFSQQQQTATNIEYVTGVEGAKAYVIPPNYQKALFDSDGKYVYVKVSDNVGRANVYTYSITPVANANNEAFVQRNEFDQLANTVAELRNAFEQSKPNNTNKTNKEG